MLDLIAGLVLGMLIGIVFEYRHGSMRRCNDLERFAIAVLTSGVLLYLVFTVLAVYAR